MVVSRLPLRPDEFIHADHRVRARPIWILPPALCTKSLGRDDAETICTSALVDLSGMLKSVQL